MNDIDLRHVLEGILVLLFSIGLHEFAHAKAADMAGDETPRRNGRLSLNPLDHFDIVGASMILFTLIAGFGIGWGKPVPVNHFNFKHPRWDNLKVSLAGIFANILIAVVAGLVLRFWLLPNLTEENYVYFHLAGSFVLYNLALAFFNLIPIPPLDGSHALSSLLPYGLAKQYDMVIGRYGLLILIALLITGATSIIISKPIHEISPLLMSWKGIAYYYEPGLLKIGS